jgi:serine/threonine-protein kinase
VAAVLEGSVRRIGERVRITARLIDVETGAVTWSERYDRRLTDVFDVEDEIARCITDALKIRFLGAPSRFVRTPTQDVGAYEAYLRGRFHWNRRTEADLQRSRDELAQAAAADPQFALAHAALAQTHVALAIYGADAPNELMPRALASAESALRLEPRLAEALTARGSVRALYEFDSRGAEDDFVQAMEAREAHPTTHQWYAMHCLAPQRRFAEARTRLARARALDPLSPSIGCSGAILRYYEHDYEQAIIELDLVLTQDERFVPALYFRGLAACELGHTGDAIDALGRACMLGGESSEHLAALAYARARGGNAGAARELLSILERRARARYVSKVLLAQVRAALEEPEGALRLLEGAVADRATELSMIDMRPTLASLRNDERFRRVLRESPTSSDTITSTLRVS